MNKKIIIADDHFVVRAGTTLILESHYKNINISYAESYIGLIEKLHQEIFDLLILDINMPGSKYLNMMKEIKEKQSELKILVFSVYDNEVAIQYIMNGADGYLSKLSDEDKILEAVESIFNTGTYYSPEVMIKLVSSVKNKDYISPINNLSEREREIFDLLLEGFGNLEISNILSLHLSTVSTYKARIFKKLKIKNTVDLIRIGDKIQIRSNYIDNN